MTSHTETVQVGTVAGDPFSYGHLPSTHGLTGMKLVLRISHRVETTGRRKV
jgi:hypothetical protein